MSRIIRRALVAFLAAGALLCAFVQPGTAASTFPSQDACHVTNNNTPRGNCGPFKQLYAEDFGSQQVPVGAFSSCGGDGDFKCAGLKTKYPHYYSTLGAYPTGWTDTAGHHGDGNSGPVPGDYRPDATQSVIKTVTNDGQMRVHMYRPSGSGRNRVDAPVPVRCMNLRYGKFSERFRVSTRARGFKMAHLRYTPNEVDYPEAGGTFQYDPISEFTHGFSESGADAAGNSAWTSWHTYSTEIVPGRISFYYDGRLFKTVHADFPDRADWILQNESALGDVPGTQPGDSVDILTTWLACYRWEG
jgi:hypothetical protein